MKYWDRNKSQQSHYQKDVQKKKPGRKRVLQVKDGFLLLVLMRLKLGLMEQHLADIFAVTVSTVSRVYDLGAVFGPHIKGLSTSVAFKGGDQRPHADLFLQISQYTSHY